MPPYADPDKQREFQRLWTATKLARLTATELAEHRKRKQAIRRKYNQSENGRAVNKAYRATKKETTDVPKPAGPKLPGADKGRAAVRVLPKAVQLVAPPVRPHQPPAPKVPMRKSSRKNAGTMSGLQDLLASLNKRLS